MGTVEIALLERLEVLPLELKGNTLVVAMADPLDEEVLQQLDFFLSYKIQPVITTTTAIHSTLKGIVGNYSPKRSSFQSLLEKHLAKGVAPGPEKPKKQPKRDNKKPANPYPEASDSDDLVDDLDEESAGQTPTTASDDSDLDLATDGASASADLDDFSISDEDVNMNPDEMSDDSLDSSEMDSDIAGMTNSQSASQSAIDDIDLAGIEDHDPFSDASLDDPDGSPGPEISKTKPQAKPAAIDPMALWGDESVLANAESEFGDELEATTASDEGDSDVFAHALEEAEHQPAKVASENEKVDSSDDLFDFGQETPSTTTSDEPSFDEPSPVKEESDEFSFDELSPVKAESDEFSFDEAGPVKAESDEFSFDEAGPVKAESDDIFMDESDTSVEVTEDDFDFGEEPELGKQLQTTDSDDDLTELDPKKAPPLSAPPLERQDSHDFSIGHLNHALAQMALAASFQEAQTGPLVPQKRQPCNLFTGKTSGHVIIGQVRGDHDGAVAMGSTGRVARNH
jgi:hypothetical protein